MQLAIPYGKDGQVQVQVDDRHVLGVIEPNTVTPGDPTEIIRTAVANPMESPSLGDFLADARDVLFIVNDATRPTPTARVLECIADDLKGKNVSFIIATGVHRAPTEEEYVQIFGSTWDTCRDRVHAHDARRDECVSLGTSKNGTEMQVNKLGVEAHKIVIIGSVEPHYFAGYTGGRKSFLPGIASFQTIEQNHKLAMQPGARALALRGNPVHEDMIDALSTVKKEIFSIQTVLDKQHRIVGATAGDIHQSFAAAIDRANEVFAARIQEKADIVVSVVKFPADIDLYQAQKGLDNAKLALKDQGIMILVAKCRDGVGEESFADLLAGSATPQEALETIDQGFRLGFHKAAKMAEIGLWAQMWGVTDLPPERLQSLFIRPFPTVQDALDTALTEKGDQATVLFLMDGSLTVPLVD